MKSEGLHMTRRLTQKDRKQKRFKMMQMTSGFKIGNAFETFKVKVFET
jgi:hypothetical protein